MREREKWRAVKCDPEWAPGSSVARSESDNVQITLPLPHRETEQIVREHNAHDALVDALEACIYEIQELKDTAQDYYESGIGGGQLPFQATDSILDKARAALALAEEK